MKTRLLALFALICCLFVAVDTSAGDPNVYWGGVQARCNNVVASFGVDNTGTTDAGPRLAVAMSALTTSAQAACLPAGTYKIATPMNVPNGLVLYGAPGVTLKSTITPGGGGSIVDTMFLQSAPATVSATTLAGNAAIGATTVSSTASVAAGTPIRLLSATHTEQTAYYYVIAVSGGGPYTFTLDRELRRPYSTSDVIQTIGAINAHVVIHGNGMLVTGTGDRWMEFLGCRDCLVEDVNFDTSGGAISDRAASWDLGSYHSTFRNVRVQGITLNQPTAPSASGLALEVAEDCLVDSSVVEGMGNYAGINLLGSVDCGVRDSHSRYNVGANGLAFTSDGSSTYGCLNCWAQGGDYNGNTATNIAISGPNDGTRLENLSASYCSSVGGAGLALASTVNGDPTNTSIVGVRLNNNTNDGLIVGTGVYGTVATNLETSNNGGQGVTSVGDLTFNNWTAQGNLNTGGGAINVQTLAQTIAGVTNANPAQITIAAHGYVTGDYVLISGTGTSLDGLTRAITVTGVNTFTFPAASGGTASSGTAKRATHVYIDGFLVTDAVSSGNPIAVASPCFLEMVNGRVTENAGSGNVFIVTGKLYASHMRVDGVGGSVTGVYVNNGATFRQGADVDLSALAGNGVYLNSGTAYWNRGTVTANGTTGVVVPFTDMQAAGYDHIVLTSTGATTAPTAYVFSQTAGTGFTIKAAVSDTDVYNWAIY